ncbi:MAG: hypothetical protein K5912_01185 [Alphaproteobacteria bacterium]|nr:hypothetical protein [Alphaproteobacteria bacterium]
MSYMKTFVFGLGTVFLMADFANAGYVTPRVKQLLREQRQKYADLEKCASQVNGFKIAGITTLGVTAAGAYGNVVLSNKIKSVEDLSEKKTSAVADNKSANTTKMDITKLDYSSYTTVNVVDCNTVFIFNHDDFNSENEALKGLQKAVSDNVYLCTSGNQIFTNGRNMVAQNVKNEIEKHNASLKGVKYEYAYFSSKNDCSCSNGFKEYRIGQMIVGGTTK